MASGFIETRRAGSATATTAASTAFLSVFVILIFASSPAADAFSLGASHVAVGRSSPSTLSPSAAACHHAAHPQADPTRLTRASIRAARFSGHSTSMSSSPSSAADPSSTPDPFDSVRARLPELSKKLLVDNVDPETLDATEVLQQTFQGPSLDKAMVGLARASGGVRTMPCLTADECRKLREFVDEQTQFKWHGENARANVHWTTRIDSVDQAPDYQINLYPSDLRNIVGEAGYRRIWSIPLGLEGGACTEEKDADDYGYKRVGIFLRKYTTDTRPLIPFHVDTNYCTGNVAINADDDYVGGNLLVCTGGKVSKAQRREGEATVHDNKVAHGVSSMVSGTRYSMILFFDKDEC